MSKKTYLLILRVGIYLSLATFFFVFSSLLFPYITSKQLSFNILVEFLTIFWVAFIFKYPEYRPKRSYISLGLLAYFIAIGVSCLLSVDFNLSFWGDAERMLGFFHLTHFLLLYFIIISAFKTESDWSIMFQLSVLAAALITIYGWRTGYIPSTIGNAAYVAALMIFNFFFLGLLWIKTNNWYLKSAYLLLLFFVLAGFLRSDISGAQAGLFAGVLSFLLVLGAVSKNKKIKWSSWGVFAFFLIAITLLFSLRSQPLFNNTQIGKMLRDFSSSNITLNTRLLSWKSAALDFKNHPVFGVGWGNYAIIFDKHFDPKFFDYTRSETYFDRAHNNLIEIVSTAGLFGLITYLAIFVAAAYYLIQTFRKKKISAAELALLVGLIVAYFVQNLALFDALVTYVPLMILLGYIYYLNQRVETPKLESKLEGEKKDQEEGLNMQKEWLVLAGAFVVMGSLILFCNIRSFVMFQGVIKGYIEVSNGRIMDGVDYYKQALSFNTGLERDGRDTLVTLISSNPGVFRYLKSSDSQSVADYVVELSQKNMSYNPYDTLAQMRLAQALQMAARLNYQSLDRFNYYSGQAMQAIDYSIEASPRRIPIYYVKADIQLSRGEKQDAIDTLNYAVSLKPDYPDSYCQLANIYFFYKEYDVAYDDYDKCLDNGGGGLLKNIDLINGSIGRYQEKKLNNPKRLIAYYEDLASANESDAQPWVMLAKLYREDGRKEQAIGAAKQAAKIDKSLSDAVDGFVKELEAEK